MCFRTPKPVIPQPDPAVEAAKYQETVRNVDRTAELKEEDTKRRRGLAYGLFGPRSLLDTMGARQTSQLRPAGS